MNGIVLLRLIVFLSVFGVHSLIIAIGILNKPPKQSNASEYQKIKLTFISQKKPEKINSSYIRKDVEEKVKANNRKIKKKIEPLMKKKIKKTPKLIVTKKKIEELVKKKQPTNDKELPVEIIEKSFLKKNFDKASTSRPKVSNQIYNLPLKKIKTRAKIGGNLSACKPNYPRSSRRRGEEGTVILRFLINERGKAERAEIKESSGFNRLDNAAKKGLFSCKFVPASENGVFVKDWAVIPYVFQLK